MYSNEYTVVLVIQGSSCMLAVRLDSSMESQLDKKWQRDILDYLENEIAMLPDPKKRGKVRSGFFTPGISPVDILSRRETYKYIVHQARIKLVKIINHDCRSGQPLPTVFPGALCCCRCKLFLFCGRFGLKYALRYKLTFRRVAST